MATVVVLLVLALAGCGGETADHPSVFDRNDPADDPRTVASVTVTRTGGIAGVHEEWRITPATPGSERVFSAADDPAVEAAAGQPAKDVCCDMFRYEMTVRYTDGHRVTVVAYEGQQADRAVYELLAAALEAEPARG